jgi:hypothetical protein
VWKNDLLNINLLKNIYKNMLTVSKYRMKSKYLQNLLILKFITALMSNYNRSKPADFLLENKKFSKPDSKYPQNYNKNIGKPRHFVSDEL